MAGCDTDDQKFMGIDDAHYAAIGKVTASWASFELYIDHACFHLAEINSDLGACFAAQVIGPGRKIDALIAIMHFRGADAALLKRARKFADRVAAVADKRNRIVHDPWVDQGVSDDGYDPPASGFGFPQSRASAPHRFQLTAKRQLVAAFFRMETAEVLNTFKEIETLHTALIELRDECIERFPLPPG